ncbi:DUF1007 family protein [Phreatobacter stygius]|uniref:DUF1007 family protein n=1 Tax=Phreatobacter stygius TaxID=1940610 RepID=UPI0014771A32|nr:DUF1007 family protein [Phreatobacter stygius]
MPRFRLPLVIGVFAACWVAQPAMAHPHVQVQTETRMVFDAQGQTVAVEQIWTFDEMYSSFAIQGLDTNRDGTYSREELAELTKINIENLGEQKYFTVLRHERRFVSFGAVRDAWSEVRGGKLTLHFTVPVATPFRPGGKPLVVEVYDPEYFVAFEPADGEPMRLVDAPQGCKLDYTPPRSAGAAANLSESFFQSLNASANFGQQFAGRYTVNCP